jgi:cupin superfamily acireductone dioxygenase involved in methionine salvage
MSFHLRQINKLPKPKDFVKQIITKSPRIIEEKSQIDILPSSNRLINSKKTNFIDLIIDQNDKIKIKNLLRQYLEENLHIDQLIKYLLQILNKQYQQNRVN